MTSPNLEDKILYCRDCGLDFIFSAREQEFYAQKGFQNEPTRCPDCRSARKQNRRENDFAPRGNSRGFNQGGGNYNRGGGEGNSNRGGYNRSNGGDNSGYNRRGNEGNYNRGYNNSGYNNRSNEGGGYNNRGYNNNSGYNNRSNEGGGYNNRGYNNSSNYGNQQERRTYTIICASCGTETEVNFMPRQGSPVYCRKCYNENRNRQYVSYE